MEIHVDHVQVQEAAARPEGPHAHKQVLHPVRRQHKHPLGVRLQESREAGEDAAPPGGPWGASCHLTQRTGGTRGDGLFWGDPRGWPEVRGAQVKTPDLKPDQTLSSVQCHSMSRSVTLSRVSRCISPLVSPGHSLVTWVTVCATVS